MDSKVKPSAEVASIEEGLKLLGLFAPPLLKTLGLEVQICLVDTNVFLPDLVRHLKKDEETGLMQAMKAPTVRVLVSDNVLEEVPEKIPLRARGENLDPDAMSTAWQERYLPWIGRIPADLGPGTDRDKRLMSRDADDVDMGRLVTLLEPEVFLSQDRDFEAYGPTAMDWSTVTVALRDKARADAVLVKFGVFVAGSSLGIYALGAGAVGGVRALTRIVRERFGAVPAWIPLAVTGVGAAFLLHPGIRASARGRLANVMERWRPTLEQIWKWASEAAGEVSQAQAAQQKAGGYIRERAPNPGGLTSPVLEVARCLARAEQPLSAAQIAGRMERGLNDEEQRVLADQVLEVLRAEPRWFSVDDDGRWRLMVTSAAVEIAHGGVDAS